VSNQTDVCRRVIARSFGVSGCTVRGWLLGVVALGLVACSQGSDNSEPPGARTVTVSGVVQKGRFQDLSVTAYALDPATGALGDPVTATVDLGQQRYTATLAASDLVLLDATGSFTNDVTGDPAILDQPLRSIVSVRGDASIDPANINIATTLQAARFLGQRDAWLGAGDALLADATALVNQALGFPAGTDLAALDLTNIGAAATPTDPNLQLLLLSAGLMSSLDSDLLFAGGFGVIVDTFATATVPGVAGLAALDGLTAQSLYDLTVFNSGYANLPALVFPDPLVLGCIADGSCSWQVVTSPTVTVSSPVVREADGEALLFVRLSEASTESLAVRLFTTGGSAVSGRDFVPTDTTLTIRPGRVQAELRVPLIIDALREPDERFLVTVEIETQDSGYAAARPGEVLIRDVLPTGREPPADALRVVELCALGTGEPGIVAVAPCSGDRRVGLGFVSAGDSVMAIGMDLAADCPAIGSCAPQSADWRVALFLVADDSSGRPVAERALGDYLYPANAVQRLVEGPDGRGVLASLAQPGLAEFGLEALGNNWTLRLEARIGTRAPLLASAPISSLLPLPATVQAGGRSVPLASVTGLDLSGGTVCAGRDGVALDAGFLMGEVRGIPSVAGGQVCVVLDYSDPSNPSAELVAGAVNLEGVWISLPAGHGFVLGGGVPLPVMLTGFVAVDGAQPAYLYHEGWPFTLRVVGAELNSGGIEIRHAGVRYLMDVDYSPQDPRARDKRGPDSNDIAYRAGAAGGSLWLTDGGLQGVLEISAGNGRTAFPLGGLSWQSFSQELRDSRLVGTTEVALSYTMTQLGDCSTPDCRASLRVNYGADAAAAALDGGGFVLGRAVTTDAVIPAWGAHPDGTTAFSRPDDLGAGAALQLALPGYRMPAAGNPANYLLAHLQPASPGGWLVPHPVGSRAFVDGNFHPVGLSVGPEIYRAPGSGAPEVGTGRSLAGLPLTINNRVDTVVLPVSIGAKYVARNAGVTGVFNVASGNLAGPVPFYGYPLRFNRFAVRLADNSLDDFNWVDGRLALQGDLGGTSGFELQFSNLAINCAARLGNMQLDWEPCDGVDNDGDGVVDENCGVRLHSWRAEGALYAAGFAGDQSCTADAQEFSLQHDLLFSALDRPVGFESRWSPAGSLVAHTAKLAPQYRLDKRPGRPETGFGFRPSSATLAVESVPAPAGVDGRYGWLSFESATIGVPFWKALDADIRVANSGLGPEHSVVLEREALANLPAAQTNAELNESAGTAADLTAAYTWGNTNFGFDMPVRFRPWQLDLSSGDDDAVPRQSRFIGRTETKDLFVMDTARAVNFIEPRRTKMSFGVSANIADLGAVSFQLDLDNPATLRKVDDFLQSLGIIGRPVLEPGLREVQDAVFFVNRLANRGLEDLMREGLERGVGELGRAAAGVMPGGQDPFVIASEALSLLTGIPAQVSGVAEDALRRPVDEALNEVTATLRAELRDIRDDIAALEVSDSIPPELRQRIAAARTLVSTANNQIGAVESGISNGVNEARGLLDDIRAQSARLQTAIEEVDRVLLQSVSFVGQTCTEGFLGNAESSGYLEQVVKRFASVRRLLDAVGGTDILLPLADLLAQDPAVRQRVRDTQQAVRRQAEDLDGYLASAEAAVRNAVCADDIGDVLTRARQVTAAIAGYDETLDLDLLFVASRLDALESQFGGILAAARDPLEQMDQLLGYLGNRLTGQLDRPGPGVVAEIEEMLAEVTGVPNIRLAAINASETDIVTLLAGPVRASVAQPFDDLRAQLGQLFETRVLPAAYSSPEQLRRLLVNEMMASVPVQRLRMLMNAHFEEIGHQVTGLVLELTDQLNFVIRQAVAAVESEVNGLLDAALAPVRAMPLKAFGVDGFGIIAGNELEQVHVGAEWELGGVAGQDPTRFAAALDAVRWGARNGVGSCGVAGAESRLDIKVSAFGLPLDIAGGDLEAQTLMLGFTLEPTGRVSAPFLPRGLFGGIGTVGKIGFGGVNVLDPSLVAGVGDVQNYLGAQASVEFGNLEAEAGFLFGRVCPGNDVLDVLDPDMARFITIPSSGFSGVYVRGGASIPLVPGGCLLNFNARADFGAWVLTGSPVTWGGLVGGAAYGEVLCVGALRGQVMALGQSLGGGKYRFVGNAFGVAGAGFDCNPETWTSVARSRRDSWCGTADAEFTAEYDNGWSTSGLKTDGIF
jgi:hypothetical protein